MRPDRKNNLCFLSTVTYNPNSDQAMVQSMVKEDCKNMQFFLCEEKLGSVGNYKNKYLKTVRSPTRVDIIADILTQIS
jgi:hypothetical protein